MPRFITSSVVLLLVAAAGVIGGAQAEPTAVARPAARDSTAGRGWGHKNKGGRHKNKGGHHVCVGAEIEFDVALPAARGVVTAPCGGAVKCCDGFYCKQETDLNTKVDGQLITQESMIYEEFTSKSDQCCIPDVYYDVTKIACPREHYEILSETCDTAGFWSTGANNLACLCCEGTIERIVDAAKIGKIFCNTANDAISNDAGCCGEVPGASGLCP